MLTVSKLKTATDILADSVGKKKDGTFVIRRGYFYRNGMDAFKFRDSVVRKLASAGIEAEVVDFGDHWAPFNGGATVARSSHFYVVVR